MIGSEFITAKKSKGEVLVFKHGALPRIDHKEDPEAHPADVKFPVVNPTTPDGSSDTISLLRQTATFHWKDVCYDIQIKG